MNKDWTDTRTQHQTQHDKQHGRQTLGTSTWDKQQNWTIGQNRNEKEHSGKSTRMLCYFYFTRRERARAVFYGGSRERMSHNHTRPFFSRPRPLSRFSALISFKVNGLPIRISVTNIFSYVLCVFDPLLWQLGRLRPRCSQDLPCRALHPPPLQH